ncbi:MAG: hypothetical protein LBG11_06300 [Bifidobacteriaceae bacterium]|nr:hypothetical protein [Bifidobacteriaceae bacterium]
MEVESFAPNQPAFDGVQVRLVAKLAAAGIAASLFLAGCSGDPDDSSASPSPLAEVGVSVDAKDLPTLTGAYGEAPTIAYPLRPGQSSPSPTPSEETPAEGEVSLEEETAGTEEIPVPDETAAEETTAEATTAEATTAEGEEANPAEGETPADGDTDSPAPSPSPESPYVKPPSSLQAQVLEGMEGTGEPVKADNLVSINLAIWEWGETETVASYSAYMPTNTFASANPFVFAVRADDAYRVGLARVIVGHKVGSRVMGVIPPSEGSLAQYLGVDEGSTLVVAIDILEQFDKNLEAQADAKPTDAKVGPKINGALGGPATVTIPADVPAPEEISTTVIATGTGAEVKDGDQILVHFSSTDWAGTNDTDTWKSERGPTPVTITADPYGDGSVLSAFSQLVGKTVGSRLLILTPGKESAYLAEAIVVDIVALVQPNDLGEDSDGAEGTEDGDAADGEEPTDPPSPEESTQTDE